MTLKIRFETDNAAFEDTTEIGRILREVAAQFDEGRASGSIRDINGNTVGTYDLTR